MKSYQVSGLIDKNTVSKIVVIAVMTIISLFLKL